MVLKTVLKCRVFWPDNVPNGGPVRNVLFIDAAPVPPPAPLVVFLLGPPVVTPVSYRRLFVRSVSLVLWLALFFVLVNRISAASDLVLRCASCIDQFSNPLWYDLTAAPRSQAFSICSSVIGPCDYQAFKSHFCWALFDVFNITWLIGFSLWY